MALPEKPIHTSNSQEPTVKLTDASFGWKQDTTTVSKLNFEAKKGDLVIVIGAVGSGKTTLLFSLMHETSLTKGNHEQSGSLAYVEQEPFIYSASVKENITFGLPFDAERFDYAVEVSQLKHDLL
jgi:ABC-type bacteriocin/lantibiotic exporter with double-glycine peptidase domain